MGSVSSPKPPQQHEVPDHCLGARLVLSWGRRPWLLWRLVPTMLRPELRMERVKAKAKEREKERVMQSAPLLMKLWTGQQRNMQERYVFSQSWGGWTMISTLMMNSLKQTLTLFQVRLQSL